MKTEFVNPDEALRQARSRRSALAGRPKPRGEWVAHLFVPYHVTDCPAQALLACTERGLLAKKTLDGMLAGDAHILYLTTLATITLPN